jgi:hypothetical protein
VELGLVGAATQEPALELVPRLSPAPDPDRQPSAREKQEAKARRDNIESSIVSTRNHLIAIAYSRHLRVVEAIHDDEELWIDVVRRRNGSHFHNVRVPAQARRAATIDSKSTFLTAETDKRQDNITSPKWGLTTEPTRILPRSPSPASPSLVRAPPSDPS